MSESIRVDTSELAAICQRLLEHLEDVVGPSVELTRDYFWSIEHEARFDMNSEPTTFTIGQLSENWSNLRSLDDEAVLSYGLVWLGEILSALGGDVVR